MVAVPVSRAPPRIWSDIHIEHLLEAKKRKSLGTKSGEYGGWGYTCSFKSWTSLGSVRSGVVILQTHARGQQTTAFSSNCCFIWRILHNISSFYVNNLCIVTDVGLSVVMSNRVVLCSIIFCCVVFCCFLLCFVLLCCVLLCCVCCVLFCSFLFCCVVLYCVLLCCVLLCFVVFCCVVLRCVTLCCIAFYFVVFCSVLYLSLPLPSIPFRYLTLRVTVPASKG